MVFSVEAKPLGEYDVVVAGGGIAGSFAAASAARQGAKVLLAESGGCLGGTLTAGGERHILDADGKGGILRELFDFLDAHGMTVARRGEKVDPDGKKIPGRITDGEGCKFFLDTLMKQSGVDVLFYSRVAAVSQSERDGRTHLDSVLLVTEAGNYAVSSKVFIDATGNGSLAALAGCGYACGEPGTGRISPASTCFSVVGLPPQFNGTDSAAEKRAYSDMMKAHDISASAEEAGIVRLPAMGEWLFSLDYQYDVPPDDIRRLTDAAIASRAEVFTAVEKHKQIPGYESIWLSQTAEHLGLREGRRIFGEYRITEADMTEGRHFDDGICLVRSKVDLHKLHAHDTLDAGRGKKTQPYEIPYRSLLPVGTDNLLLAGRCLSGDFYPHASYRMMGNMAATGEAAGFAAAVCATEGVALRALPPARIRERMKEYL
ncbi:MAG: FAD-dependent oxidoreductase [Oscillospiraceae bacterium]|nr:FAD-dependent oxidoreductase [Oscillospiraceae bacterium]